MFMLVGYALMVGSAAGAMIFGGRTHRLIGVLLIVSGVLTPHMQAPAGAPQWGLLALDILTAIPAVMLLLRHRRPWLMLVTALILMMTATHLAVLLDPSIRTYAHFTLLIIYSYGIYLTLIAGVIGHLLRDVRRERAHSQAMARELIARLGPEAAAEADRLMSGSGSPSERLRARGLVRAVRRLSAT